jgi:nucleotide-binding universal stress UspA family protein
MYKKILVPVDLAHLDRLDRALTVAADLARHWGATVVYAGVGGTAPGPEAPTPEAYAARLHDFAAAQAAQRGIATASHPVISHDAAVEANRLLLQAIDRTGADLVVMATHAPSLLDWVFASHGGYLAEHAPVSVMLVR